MCNEKFYEKNGLKKKKAPLSIRRQTFRKQSHKRGLLLKLT
jgi:hypothetical protein